MEILPTMRLKRPATENERLLASALFVFVLFFGLNSLVSVMAGGTIESGLLYYSMALSFVVGMGGGVLFYLWTGGGEEAKKKALDRNLEVLKRALEEGEAAIIDAIKDSEGLTQDSLRFRTGFSRSKVSAIVSDLEKKGILNRVRIGKTYKIFFNEWLKRS